MGTPYFARQILYNLIINNFNILAIFTQEDKPFGRTKVLKQSEVKILAQELLINIPIFTPKTLKDDILISKINILKPDFIIVAAYGKLLPKEILNIAPCINLHASLLPKYRGASPIQSAILNGDEISGVCSMLMNEELDAGDILEIANLNIKNKKANIVFNELGELASKICISTLKNFNNIIPCPQNKNNISFCSKIIKQDGLINLDNAKIIYQKFLAFYPWPGVFLENKLKFLELELENEDDNQNQGIILYIKDSYFLLSCKKGTLRVLYLQESGKKVLDGRTYLNGKRLKIGDSLI